MARNSAPPRATSACSRATPEFDVARRRLSHSVKAGDPLLIEDKGGALVLHYRLHPHLRDRAEALAQAAVAGLDDLYACDGHYIFEIRQRGISKAVAIELFADQPAFRKRLPVFVGDDSTDEDGLRGAAKAGGFGIKVGPGSTRADYCLPRCLRRARVAGDANLESRSNYIKLAPRRIGGSARCAAMVCATSA